MSNNKVYYSSVRGDNYSNHLLAHKKFICSKCGMRFYKSESLEDHEKTHARGPKTHKCETCGKYLNIEGFRL